MSANRRGNIGQRVRAVLGDSSGNAAVELALALPLLTVIVLGVLKFAVTFQNQIELSEAVRTAARTFASAIGAGTTTPWTATQTAIQNGDGTLTDSKVTWSVKVAGTKCTTDTACETALTTAGEGGMTTVTASYPCDLSLGIWTLLPSCTLTSTTNEMIE
jgi:Flp pilus assembly protein TadG